jgi:hypothetical protein
MLVSDVLRVKGHNVVKIHATDSVELAVRGWPSTALAP